jgi:hypothetical protein
MIRAWWHRLRGHDVKRGHVCLAVDRNGQKYTEHTFATDGDPWLGALIITPGHVPSLRKRGLLPLTEIEVACDLAADR